MINKACNFHSAFIFAFSLLIKRFHETETSNFSCAILFKFLFSLSGDVFTSHMSSLLLFLLYLFFDILIFHVVFIGITFKWLSDPIFLLTEHQGWFFNCIELVCNKIYQLIFGIYLKKITVTNFLLFIIYFSY